LVTIALTAPNQTISGIRQVAPAMPFAIASVVERAEKEAAVI